MPPGAGRNAQCGYCDLPGALTRGTSFETESDMADLQKVCRNLFSLKATEKFLRQYPRFAAKVDAALDKAEKPALPSR